MRGLNQVVVLMRGLNQVDECGQDWMCEESKI